MKDESDIVNELRKKEKLGTLQSKVQSEYKELESIEESSEEAPDKAVGFIDDNVKRETMGNQTRYEITDEELQLNLEKLKSIISSIDLVFILDKEGIFIGYYQPRKRSDLYVPPEVFIGKSFKKVLPPHVVKLLDDAIKKVVTTSTVQQFDYPMDIADKELWFNAKVSMCKDSYDKFAGTIVVVRDITKRKQVEEGFKKKSRSLSDISNLPSVVN